MSRLPAIGLALLLLAAPARGQGTLPYHGSEVFRFALHQKKVVPIDSFPEAMSDPPASMIVVLGDTRLLPRIVRSPNLVAFVRNGGALLIATDSTNQVEVRLAGGAVDRGWGQAFGITVTGQHLVAGRDDTYRPTGQARDAGPFVAPLPRFPDRPGPFASNLFAGFAAAGEQGVATDRPSEMFFSPGLAPFPILRLARYPVGARRVLDGARVQPDRNNFGLAIETDARPGRVLVLADQSVFANGMLGFVPDPDADKGYRFDNANWEFAKRTIDWLQASGRQARTKCLFIEDGNVITKFADELPPPPKPPVPNIPPEVLANILLNHSNGVINELQERNYFNRLAEGFFPRIVRAFLIMATILFLFYGLRWLMRGQRKPEPAAATGPAQQAALLPRGGVLRQRTAAQLEVGNLSEAAGRRVRDRFDVLGGRPGPAGDMPPVLVAIDIHDAPLLKQTVRWLWAIGYGQAPAHVPPVEWDRMNGLLERVTARAARGDWSFGADA